MENRKSTKINRTTANSPIYKKVKSKDIDGGFIEYLELENLTIRE